MKKRYIKYTNEKGVIPPFKETLDLERMVLELYDTVEYLLSKMNKTPTTTPITPTNKNFSKYQTRLISWTVKYFKRKKIKATHEQAKKRIQRYKAIKKYTKEKISLICDEVVKQLK